MGSGKGLLVVIRACWAHLSNLMMNLRRLSAASREKRRSPTVLDFGCL